MIIEGLNIKNIYTYMYVYFTIYMKNQLLILGRVEGSQPDY